MWSESLTAAALGGIIALTAGWLAAWLPLRERRTERKLEALNRRRDFERENLQTLFDVLPSVMRDATLVHFADAESAKRTGIYAGHMLPQDLTPNELEHGRRLARHISLILDDELRAQAEKFHGRLHASSLPGSRTLTQGESDFARLVGEYESLNETLAKRIRLLWDQVAVEN